jgi:hypothetical protein
MLDFCAEKGVLRTRVGQRGSTPPLSAWWRVMSSTGLSSMYKDPCSWTSEQQVSPCQIGQSEAARILSTVGEAAH